jgi:hypothetical protein
VNRGGSFNNTASNARSANRNNNTPENRDNNLGLRPAKASHHPITVAPSLCCIPRCPNPLPVPWACAYGRIHPGEHSDQLDWQAASMPCLSNRPMRQERKQPALSHGLFA